MSPINYIRRESENLTTAIEQIYGLRVNNEPDKCLKIASETFSSLLNIDLLKILEYEDDTFLVEIIKLDLTAGFIQNLSEFMLETAEIFHILNKPIESMNLKKKLMKLLQYQKENDKTYSDERIELMKLLQSEIDKQKI
jgi:hypothetical protein